MIFADPALRRYALAWQEDAPRLLASFRRDFAVAPNDEVLGNLISDLERLSPEFRAWWRSHDVEGCTRGLSTLDVSGIGAVRFEHEMLTVDEDRHLRLVVYAAQPADSNTPAFEAILATGEGHNPHCGAR